MNNEFDFSPLGIVCENAMPVEEAKSALMAYNKLVLSKKAKAANSLTNQARKLQKKGEFKEAIAKYTEAKAILTELKKDARNVPDESWKDFALMLIPYFGSFLMGEYVAVKIYQGKGKDATRNQTIEEMSGMISVINGKIAECKKGQK